MNRSQRETRGDLVFAFWAWVALAALTFAAFWFWGVVLDDWSVGLVATFTAIVMGMALLFAAVRAGWRRWRRRRTGV